MSNKLTSLLPVPAPSICMVTWFTAGFGYRLNKDLPAEASSFFTADSLFIANVAASVQVFDAVEATALSVTFL